MPPKHLVRSAHPGGPLIYKGELLESHWQGKPDPDNHLGFIYLIKDETAHKYYVGKKQFWLAKRAKGCKGSSTDKRSKDWKQKCWVESDWMNYKGSSPTLFKWMRQYPDNLYTYHILHQCYSKSELHYKEIEELVLRGVMWKRGEDGDYLYFNRSIPAIRFRVTDRPSESIFYQGGSSETK